MPACRDWIPGGDTVTSPAHSSHLTCLIVGHGGGLGFQVALSAGLVNIQRNIYGLECHLLGYRELKLVP